MLDAKDARKMTEKYRSDKIAKQINEIEIMVSKAASAGEDCCYYCGSICKDVSDLLVKQGYGLENRSSQIDGPAFLIRW